MNTLEKKLINTLIDLKKNHNITSVKAEFEDEGSGIEETIRLKEIATQVGLDFTIKIGGCGALKDLHDAKKIVVNSIVAPMVESAYAMKKFVHATKQVFSEDERNRISFFINIETITGYNNLDDILSKPEIKEITGHYYSVIRFQLANLLLILGGIWVFYAAKNPVLIIIIFLFGAFQAVRNTLRVLNGKPYKYYFIFKDKSNKTI